jgi:hypothetical protein
VKDSVNERRLCHSLSDRMNLLSIWAWEMDSPRSLRRRRDMASTDSETERELHTDVVRTFLLDHVSLDSEFSFDGKVLT